MVCAREKSAPERMQFLNEVPNFAVKKAAILFKVPKPGAGLNALLLITALLMAMQHASAAPPVNFVKAIPETATARNKIFDRDPMVARAMVPTINITTTRKSDISSNIKALPLPGAEKKL